MMKDGEGQTFFDRGFELDSGELADEDVDAAVEMDMEDVLTEMVPPDLLDEETRQLAAGLASLNEGDLLAALESMQKAVIGPDGNKVLATFVLASPHCAEIMGAWERGAAAATAIPVMVLLYHMFRHPLGTVGGTCSGLSITEKEAHRKVMSVKLRLDKIARSIVRTRMKDIYSHLSSSQKSRQNAALLLLSVIVLRGRALAIEIATSFDFTLEALRKLGHFPKQGISKTVRVEGSRGILKQPTRVAFVELAISFLTIGDPGLLRWILQKRPLWTGVLHGISKDDEKTIVRVLTLLQEKVMAPAFMVPRGLQSVLFGDATLEQLARISSDHSLGDAGELAHATLLSLCTDPSHGLCPEESELLEAALGRTKSGGSQGRLLRLMVRLKVTEVDRHRDVLLATARARPQMAISYLASFPFSLEPRVSPAWLNAMSLISQLIPIASQPSSFSSLEAQSISNGHLVQSILQSLLPSSLSRVVFNRGLLHVDVMVKHASLRVLVEALICLRRLINAIDDARSLEAAQLVSGRSSGEFQGQTRRLNSFVASFKTRVIDDSPEQGLMKVGQSIQDFMRVTLPDPNTLLAILSSLKSPRNSRSNTALISSEPHSSPATKKRKRQEEQNARENHELKSSVSESYDYDATIRLLWGPEILDETSQREGVEGLLYAKVVEVLAAYQVALPVAMADTGFDAFKLLPDDPSSLSLVQQRSLSALLLAATGSSTSPPSEEGVWFVGGFAGFGSAYKSFKRLLMFMLFSEVVDVRDAAYEVAHRVMSSTKAFESNPKEIFLWLDLLVQWTTEKSSISHDLEEIIGGIRQVTLRPRSMYTTIVEFLSEAVSSIGQNSYKYLDSLHSILSKYVLEKDTENSLLPSGSLHGLNTSEFGPFAVCTLEKFIHIISKGKVPAECTTVALYLVNVFDLLLKYQIYPQSLAMVIVTMISRERESLSPERVKSPEWTVLLVLFERAQLLLSEYMENNSGTVSNTSASNLGQGYQSGKFSEMLRGCGKEHDMTLDEKVLKLTSSAVCISIQELVDNFPLLMRFCLEDLNGDFSIPIALLGIHQGVLAKVSTAWPELFTEGLEQASRVKCGSEDKVTVGTAKELAVTLGSTSLTVETRGFCVLLLMAPFPVLFSTASFCRKPLLLAVQSFVSFLQEGLLRAHHRNGVCMVRLIISGMKHLAALSVEDIGDGAPIHTCFSLLRNLVLPVQQSTGGSFPSDEMICPSRIMPGYEDVIVDLLKHPVFYNLFMHGDNKHIPPMTPSPFASDLRRDTKDEKVRDTALKRTLASAASCVHPIDCHILSLLIQILTFSKTTVNRATIPLESHGAVGFWRKILSAYKPYALKAIGAFQKDVDEISNFGLSPSPALFAVSALIPYTDSSLLLSVFLSLLSTRALKVKSSKRAVSPHVLGLHFVTVFVHSLSGAAPHLRNEEELSNRTWDRKVETHSGGPYMCDVFEKVADHVIGSPSIMADLCLLSFLQAPKFVRSPIPGFEMSLNNTSAALACSTPLEVLRHCVCHPNNVTGKIAFLLVETSLVHLTEFGRLIAVGTAERGPSITKSRPSLGLAEMLLTQSVGNQTEEFSLSDEDLLYLLPASKVYIVTESRRGDAKANEFVNHITSVYSKLLTKRLQKWEKFVSESIATDEVEEIRLPVTTLQPLSDLYNMLMQFYNCSSLGGVVHMLQSCQILHPFSLKVKTKLIQSLLAEDGTPLVTQNMWLSAGADITSCAFEAVAKADILRNVLSSGLRSRAIQNVFAPETGGQETGQRPQTSDLTSLQESSVWLRFLRSLMNTLGLLYKSKALDGNRKIGTNGTQTESDAGRTHWGQFLEEYLLTQVTNAAKKLAESSLNMSEYLPLYKHSMTTLLGYRYGETSAMKACRHLTFVVFQGLQSQMLKDTLADCPFLELLIAHSKFLPSLLIMDSKRMHIPHIAGKHVGKGTALNALSSVLSLIGSPVLNISTKARGIFTEQDSVGEAKSVLNMTDVNRNSRDRAKYIPVKGACDEVNRLEIIKLLRILLGVRLKQLTLGARDVQSLPLDDVMSILLAAYGGTLSSVDQEIFLSMQEIESLGGLGFSGLSRLDYLWGEAALKRRRAKAEELITNVLKEPDSIDDIRRQTFKEDLLIDPRRCGLAVLFFPLKRKFGVADIGQLGLINQYEESNEEISEQRPESNDEDLKDAAYDPAFLLPFALHGLSIGCINAEEFVRLGLLAIAFASMSSAEESMRKAGYELLAKYYSILEDGPSFKGRLQIRLLMTYVKNAVTEPWQRIPVVFSVFAAEASCILNHPESHQYAIINRFLLRAPSLDLESVPLFQVMFGSGSVQYRSDRLWMLRLLAAGLRTSLDARVFRRRFVIELLMSFHDSSMADTFPQKWVLQVLYQAAAVRSFSRYLVEHTGVLSWLSSVALNDIEGGLGPQDDGGSGQIASMALQVIERILSWENLHRHSFLDCLEELSKAGHVFYHILVTNPTHQYQNLFRRSTFKILLTLASLSHKRRKHETHFTLNLGALVEVLHLVPGIKPPVLLMEDGALALQLVLHVPPMPVNSYEDKLALFKVASWAQSIALELETNKRSSVFANSKDPTTTSPVLESLSEKLLRWVAASVVLGELGEEERDVRSREKVSTLSVIGCLNHTKILERGTASKNLDEKLASLLLALEGHVSGNTEGTSLVPVAAALIVLTRLTRSSIHPGEPATEKAQQKIQCILELLLLELPHPDETNSSWQWSFNSPWTAREETAQSTDEAAVQCRYVSEVCRTIILLLQQILLRQRTHHMARLSQWYSLLSVKPQTDDESDSDPIVKRVRIKLKTLQTRLCTALQRIFT